MAYSPHCNMEKGTYRFDLPTHHQSIIKVIGVGGGGSNAVNNMYHRGIKDVSFVVCNTDAQALENSPIQYKLQLGIHLTGGLGAGANPEVGKNAALESKDDIKELLSDATKMVFVTAGMAGVSKGPQGGAFAMSHLTDIFHYLKMHVYPLKPRLGNILDSQLATVLANAQYVQLLEEQAEGIINY